MNELHQLTMKMRRLTNNKGLFESCPGDVVPWRPAGRVDCPFVRAQEGRLRLGLARGAFWW